MSKMIRSNLPLGQETIPSPLRERVRVRGEKIDIFELLSPPSSGLRPSSPSREKG
jgi:hypothetical protein